MRLVISRRQLLASGILGGICASTGCGTILYPERRGQPEGTLDWGVVLLDGLGLLLFFVPGVIAFAVDFATGAIYLPSAEGQRLSAEGKPRRFETISLSRSQLSPPEIAQAVSRHTGTVVRLEEGKYQTARLRDLDEFWLKSENLLAEQSLRSPSETLRGQSP